MSRASIANIPINLTNPIALRRFLTKLVEQIDVALGNYSDAVTGDINVIDRTETAVGQSVETPNSLAALADNLLQDAIADSSGLVLADLEAQVNDILAKLRLAKIIKS